MLHSACTGIQLLFAYPENHMEIWLVNLFLSRKKFHAKQMFVLSSSMKLGPVPNMDPKPWFRKGPWCSSQRILNNVKTVRQLVEFIVESESLSCFRRNPIISCCTIVLPCHTFGFPHSWVSTNKHSNLRLAFGE